MSTYAWSFFFGWVIKAAYMRFGGPGTVRRLRPLFVGVIAGEMAVAVVFSVIGIIYYAVTGKPPVPYRWLRRGGSRGGQPNGFTERAV